MKVKLPTVHEELMVQTTGTSRLNKKVLSNTKFIDYTVLRRPSAFVLKTGWSFPLFTKFLEHQERSYFCCIQFQ